MSSAVTADPSIKHHLDDPITQHMRRDFSRLHVHDASRFLIATLLSLG